MSLPPETDDTRLRHLAVDSMTDHLTDSAAAAASQGMSVFPVRPGDKRPAVPDWEHKACADADRVARYWPAGANIGIACGPSRLVVVDLDCHTELPEEWRLPGLRDGRDVLAQLAEWASQPWPSTYTVRTPSGGWHLYFAAPKASRIRNSASLIGPQIDVRAAGGYVVGEGSVIGGKRYEVVDGREAAELPDWIRRLLVPPVPQAARPVSGGSASARLQGLVKAVRQSQPGDRTGPLVWAAHRLAEMIGEGEASPADAENLVQAAVEAGINGGESYARYQVRHVLGGGW